MFIGIDLGTSSVKMILINQDQKILASANANLSIQSPYEGYNEQNPNDWIIATEKCLHKLKETKPKEFVETVSIGFPYQVSQTQVQTRLSSVREVLRTDSSGFIFN